MKEHEHPYWSTHHKFNEKLEGYSNRENKNENHVAHIAYEHGKTGLLHKGHKLTKPEHKDVYDVCYGMGKDKV